MNHLYCCIAICLLYSSLVVSSPAAPHTNATTSYRLPTAVHPEHYKLEILTHLGDDNGFKFYGRVWIKIICDEDTHNITLHARSLDINTTKLELKRLSTDGKKKESVFVENTDFDLAHEFFIIYTRDTLVKGETYELYMPFEAELEQGLLGYYRSSYFDKKSQKRIWLAVSQFEATYARRAFPCFDEPEMKAKFEIILGHDKKYTALSNMPVKQTMDIKDKPDWVWDHFEETVPMSTYLVAYTINDFEYRESVVKMTDDVVFRIWARRDAIDQVDYAKYVGPKVLKFYEDYFDIKFPLPKMDMIAIPDFSAGAMENWGLVTYRETALLYSPMVSSSSSQHRVASVIAHELAHQWFGNLVTMKWWTDLWLNEGFATYVASLGVEYLHPEWNSFKEESVENTLDIFKFDALKSSHPVSVPIGDPAEISQIFDKISYQKGSSILRMMHLFLGEETFQKGVSNYLKKHKYGNAQQDNLWECLTDEARKHNALPEAITVKQIMDAWTLQTGYPMINVVRDYKRGTADVTQVRYLADIVRSRADLDTCWWVPLSYTTAHELNFNDTHPKEWLSCDNNEIAVPKTLKSLPDATQWVLFNIDLSGLYKVKYDEKNWDLLIEQLSGPDYIKISAANRAQLIDDALDLAWTGDQDYSIALRLVDYLKHEREYIPWKSALDNLNAVNVMLKRSPQFGLFQEYMRKILNPIYKTVGGLNADRSATDRLDAVKHKVLIASWSCRFQVGDCQEKSKEYFRNWMATEDPDTTNPIPLDLRSVVYCSAIRSGNEKEWNFLWKRYGKSNVGTERTMILSALGCSREIWLLMRYLDYSLDEELGVRKQDSGQVFASIVRGDIGFHIAKSFFENRIDDLYNYLQPDTARLARYVKPLAEQMTSMKEYEDLKEFVSNRTKIFAKSTQSIKQSLETIEINSQWNTNNYKKIGRFLSAHLTN